MSSLPRLTARQGLTEILAGTMPRNQMIGGILIYGPSLVITGYVPYDADSNQLQKSGHYTVSQNFAAPNMAGPFKVNNQLVPASAGVVNGYMTSVPPEFQTELGPYLTGNSNLSIITRTSNRPSATMFDPAKLGQSQGKTVLGYSMDHNTLKWGWSRTVTAMVFVPGTRTIAFFGRGSTVDAKYPNDCYGIGTAKKELHGTRVPGTPPGSTNDSCYDLAFPSRGDHGPHGYPYTPWVWLYDANDLVRVKNGKADMWEIAPYADGPIPIPPELISKSGDVYGVALDPATKRLFVYAGYIKNYGLLHQFMRYRGSACLLWSCWPIEVRMRS